LIILIILGEEYKFYKEDCMLYLSGFCMKILSQETQMGM
jgi:hypothetical protein